MFPHQINRDAVNNSSIFLEVISGDNSHTVFFKYTHLERVSNRAQVMLTLMGEHLELFVVTPHRLVTVTWTFVPIAWRHALLICRGSHMDEASLRWQICIQFS